MRTTSKWEIFEESWEIDDRFNNPFTDVLFQAVFSNGQLSCTVDGFYNGGGT